MVIAHNQGQEFATAQEHPRYAIGLIGGLDKQFIHLPDEMTVAIVGFSAEKICGVQHGTPFSSAGRQILRPRACR
jgi:hypothetical protein